MTFSYHASTKLDEVTTINCTFQPAKQTRSNSFNYRVIQKWNSIPNSIDFTSLKRFHKSLAPEVLLPYCMQGNFYLVGCAAYRQYVLYFILMCILNYFSLMHVNVSGRSVLLFWLASSLKLAARCPASGCGCWPSCYGCDWRLCNENFWQNWSMSLKASLLTTTFIIM